MSKKIAVNILSKDRPTELGMLLTSIISQTHQDYDIFILDDCSGTPLTNYHFLNVLFEYLRNTGHYIDLTRNDRSKGVSYARQKLVDRTLEVSDCDFICRLDDDTVIETDYFERLLRVIDAGYDLASGVTPTMAAPGWQREIRFVYPIINRVVLDKDGGFLVNTDDCGHTYIEDAIIPMHHFRSCALVKREVHEKVSYEEVITPCGFREEEFFSFRMILAGYTLGCNTGAKAWHLQAPSGGDRRQQYAQMANENQRLLNVFTKKMYKKQGDFIEAYNQKLGIQETDATKFISMPKNTNLIFNKDE